MNLINNVQDTLAKKTISFCPVRRPGFQFQPFKPGPGKFQAACPAAFRGVLVFPLLGGEYSKKRGFPKNFTFGKATLQFTVSQG
ncbi:MAG: hypothetical protein LBS37_09395 [Treponema sp.]|jgi:hypothetical protein|nr:hypothetical protein [Treponema sp.]